MSVSCRKCPEFNCPHDRKKKSMHACTHIHTHLTPCTQTGSSQASAPLPPTLPRPLKMASVSPHGYNTGGPAHWQLLLGEEEQKL